MCSDYDSSFNSKIACSLNKSLSKASYSFSKQVRFKDNRADPYFHFYNLPDLRDKHGIKIGNAIRFPKKSGVYCNNQYDFPSSFDPDKHNSPQYSFGLKNHAKLRRNNSCGPGPKYDTRTNLGKFGPSYSVGKQVKFKSCRTSACPGPGDYDTFEKLPLGQHTLSRYRNASGVFLSTTTRRFPKDNYACSPGPAYQLPSLFAKQNICESKFKSSPGISFSGKKTSIYRFNRYSSSPGPGAYDRFSEFESWEKKEKGKK